MLAHDERPALAAAFPSPEVAKPARMVIVDDCLSAVSHLQTLVAKNISHCEAIPFTSSGAALRYCQTNDVDLVVIDYLMPVPNGLQFIEYYRDERHNCDTPIIMVTGEHARDVRYMALQLGATDFLNKPVDEIEFITRVRNLLTLSRHQKAVANRAEWLADEVSKATRSVIERERESILFLCRAAEHRDPETGAHLRRMASYSRLIAHNMGLGNDQADLIFTAAPMHDVGKIGIPDKILLKPGRLAPEEVLIMQRHTTYGAEILAGSTSPLLQLSADIARCHHERMDGTGYPNGLAGAAIPLVGRIVALADVFDALTSKRPYKDAWPMEKALAYVADQAGSHFDPMCVEALMADRAGVCRIAMVTEGPGQALRPSRAPRM